MAPENPSPVKRALKTLKNGKVAGCDNIPFRSVERRRLGLCKGTPLPLKQDLGSDGHSSRLEVRPFGKAPEEERTWRLQQLERYHAPDDS